jgi:hypothetical protein
VNTTRLVQARRLFNSPYVHPHVNRENQRRWVCSVRKLGDKWLLAQPQVKEFKQ